MNTFIFTFFDSWSVDDDVAGKVLLKLRVRQLLREVCGASIVEDFPFGPNRFVQVCCISVEAQDAVRAVAADFPMIDVLEFDGVLSVPSKPLIGESGRVVSD